MAWDPSRSPSIIISTGIFALLASLISFTSIYLHAKNYTKPLLQRSVIRIQLLVPIYAFSSWFGLATSYASVVEPVREIYEAFVLYQFFALLISFLGGERNLIMSVRGRPPHEHPWPLNLFLPKIDIGDPLVFLSLKRGILQYAWLNPLLALSTILLRAVGTYGEGSISLFSPYTWLGIVYNLSVTLSLYCLTLFWISLSRDLQPFRPVSKFLCVKAIIFASYWQGFTVKGFMLLGLISGTNEYKEHIAVSYQNFILCYEIPFFALAHWYAFSYTDYADEYMDCARMPFIMALKDAFGCVDVFEDFKQTLFGSNYDYRLYKSTESVVDHPTSTSRRARTRQGLRYHNGGEVSYWLPKRDDSLTRYGAIGPSVGRTNAFGDQSEEDITFNIDKEDEALYSKARGLVYGDYNYPVIGVHSSRHNRLSAVPRGRSARRLQRSSADESQNFLNEPSSPNDNPSTSLLSTEYMSSHAALENHGTNLDDIKHNTRRREDIPASLVSLAPSSLRRQTSATSNATGQLNTKFSAVSPEKESSLRDENSCRNRSNDDTMSIDDRTADNAVDNVGLSASEQSNNNKTPSVGDSTGNTATSHNGLLRNEGLNSNYDFYDGSQHVWR